ncbi:MAG: winged helix-turn-helix transcriptional regulator [Deltaproteobacteria bacterium]|nr:winged helix-turn-helix transcriptional regulator [Deltaproteobacteria bacterium]
MKGLNLREKAAMLRLLGHPTRLLILEELARGAKCVTDIRDLLNIPQPNVSQHLAVLRQARLVDFYEDGQLRCYYLLRPAFVTALLEFLGAEYPVTPREREDVRQEGRLRDQGGGRVLGCGG